MDVGRSRGIELAPWAATSLLLSLLVLVWVGRFAYPYDLEWMEGGMLAHAWRLDRGLPLYLAPNPDFIPYIYPPGYAATVAVLAPADAMSLPLGRAVSLVGTLAAAAALGFAVWRHTAAGAPALFAAAVFLGTFPDSGAFFDLVRPDALAMGFAAWSLALAAERWRGATEAAGVLLAAAFVCKHNSAAFGLPILVGLTARDGWRAAIRFTVASAGPAILFTIGQQVTSEGHFLRYLLEVPASHPMNWDRILPGLPRELGNALPVSVATIGAFTLLRLGDRAPAWVAGLGSLVGVGLATGVHLAGPLPGDLLHVPAAVGAWGLGVLVVAAPSWARVGRPGWRWWYAAATGLLALTMAGLMRSHHGGYINVHLPLHWVVACGFGLVLGELWSTDRRALASLLATAELLYAAGTLDADALQPSAEDVEAGDRLVRSVRGVRSPVLSPVASWIPVQAGHPPSLHMISVWDLIVAGGPYEQEVVSVKRAIDERYWGAVIEGDRSFNYPLDGRYQVDRVVAERDGVLQPRSGWRVRPVRVLVPRPVVASER